MANDISIASNLRSNLLLLQNTQSQIEKTQTKLSTGNRVNSALDGPTEFFAAKGLNTRAGDLSRLKDSMGQAISTIKAADTGITSIQQLVEQMKGITTSALGSLGNDAASVATRKSLAQQFNALKEQVDALAADSGYQGKNLLVGNGLRIDSSSSSRADVNTIAGISNARTTNVSAADTYSIRITGDGAVSGNASDISSAELAHGLTGLKISGTISSSLGSFEDFKVQVSGSAGQLRTFTVSDGSESRVTRFFDNTQAATTNLETAAATTTPQTSSVTIAGTIEEGDVFSVTVEGKTYEYKAGVSSDGATTEAAATVASKLAALISGASVTTYYRAADGSASQSTISSPGAITTSAAFNGQTATTTDTTATDGTFDVGYVSAAGGKITISGDNDEEFTISSTTENALTKRISESFASGSVVSFTVDRNLLESASNGGNGTSAIQKNVNVDITVTALSGEQVSRSGTNERGAAKLADGENSFAFGTGTVRLDVDEKTILQAASASAAANLVTSQIADANTQNDITVQFNERNTNTIQVQSQNVTTSGTGLKLDYAQNNFLDRADIEQAISGLDNAQQVLRNASQSLSTNLNVITTRENFTKEFSNVLVEGANKLTLADQNEEGTALLALQTRQQLATISLSLANQQQQSILRLF